MVVRIPGLDEPALFGPPIVSEATLFDELPDETRAEMERLQAIDDAVFIACSLADLTARHRGAALAAEEQAFLSMDDPEAAIGHVDGFAARLDDGFAADVEAVVQKQGQLTGSRPSAEGLDLFRRRAEGVRRGALARNVMLEDGLRQRNQRRMMMRAIDGLQATVQSEPDVLDEALGRLGDLTGASRALIGDELAGQLEQSTRLDLASAAAKGLIAQDPDTGLEALRSGAYDSHLDEVTRKRLIGEAEGLSRARTQDRERQQRQKAAELASMREAAALDFMTGFRTRLETGEAGFAEIVAAQEDGTLSKQRADLLHKELQDRQQQQAVNQQKIETVSTLLRDGVLLDPDDPDHRDLADIFFDSVVMPEAQALPPRDRIQLFENLPESIGIMPPGAMCPLGGLVLAGEPADRVAAAQAIAGIIGKHPGARDCLPPPAISLADALTDLAPLQIPADEAIKHAEEGLRGLLVPHDPGDGQRDPVDPGFAIALSDGSNDRFYIDPDDLSGKRLTRKELESRLRKEREGLVEEGSIENTPILESLTNLADALGRGSKADLAEQTALLEAQFGKELARQLQAINDMQLASADGIPRPEANIFSGLQQLERLWRFLRSLKRPPRQPGSPRREGDEQGSGPIIPKPPKAPVPPTQGDDDRSPGNRRPGENNREEPSPSSPTNDDLNQRVREVAQSPNRSDARRVETDEVNRREMESIEQNPDRPDDAPDPHPPYKPGTETYEYKVGVEGENFIRLHGDENVLGQWMVPESDIQGLSPEEIKDLYALPNEPTLQTEVVLPEGTDVRVGIANGHPEWGSGGGTQFETIDFAKREWFGTSKEIGE